VGPLSFDLSRRQLDFFNSGLIALIES